MATILGFNDTNATSRISTIVVDPTRIFGPQRDTLYIVLPITIMYTLIFITGLLGNMFTCLVIIRNKSMHTATNYYLFSLAISDLLLLVTGMPQEMYSIWSKWPYVFGNTFCIIRGLASETSTNASVLTITLFTVERYLAICHPFVSHKMSKLTRATRHVLMLWVAALALALPQALQFGVKDHQGVLMCLQTRIIIKHSFEISLICFFFAPMILITVLYSLIGLRLKKAHSGKDNMDHHKINRNMRFVVKAHRKHGQSTKRVVKMLVAVVVAFFVCWAPFHAQRLVAIYGTKEDHRPKSKLLLYTYYILTYTSGVFYYMSTCINPILYHIMSNKFRDAFKNSMLRCCRMEDGIGLHKCSYTTVALARNPTSSGTDHSGKELRNESSSLLNTNREKISQNTCQNLHEILDQKEMQLENCRINYDRTQRDSQQNQGIELKNLSQLGRDNENNYPNYISREDEHKPVFILTEAPASVLLNQPKNKIERVNLNVQSMVKKKEYG